GRGPGDMSEGATGAGSPGPQDEAIMQDDFDNGMEVPDDDLAGDATASEDLGDLSAGPEGETSAGAAASRPSGGARARSSAGAAKSGGKSSRRGASGGAKKAA